MKLVKYRDTGMNTYTYFWTNSAGHISSPFFDSEDQAQEWLTVQLMSQTAQENSK